jgi:hypothetical protein
MAIPFLYGSFSSKGARGAPKGQSYEVYLKQS